MDFNATIDLIIKDLREASDIIDDLKNYPGIPVIQVELAKLKCKSAGEVIGMLKTLKFSSSPAEKEAMPQVKVQVQAPAEEVKPVVPPEIIIPPVAEPAAKVTLPAAGKPSSGIKNPASAILADQFSHLAGSFNEQVGSLKNEEGILNSKHLTSLTEAIGVNDKFFFIREIFNGNQNDYNQAITRLESAENVPDAMAVIMSYTGGNDENDAVKQLLDLVKRKLPVHE